MSKNFSFCTGQSVLFFAPRPPIPSLTEVRRQARSGPLPARRGCPLGPQGPLFRREWAEGRGRAPRAGRGLPPRHKFASARGRSLPVGPCGRPAQQQPGRSGSFPPSRQRLPEGDASLQFRAPPSLSGSRSRRRAHPPGRCQCELRGRAGARREGEGAPPPLPLLPPLPAGGGPRARPPEPDSLQTGGSQRSGQGGGRRGWG